MGLFMKDSIISNCNIGVRFATRVQNLKISFRTFFISSMFRCHTTWESSNRMHHQLGHGIQVNGSSWEKPYHTLSLLELN
jgi:hypothetical protein